MLAITIILTKLVLNVKSIMLILLNFQNKLELKDKEEIKKQVEKIPVLKASYFKDSELKK